MAAAEYPENIADVVLDYLLENHLTLSCAESCTGGLFSKIVTDRPGISAVFDRGLVTYSNRAKIAELNVSPEILEKYTAVSEETACAMAEGLAAVSGSDICVSVTGYAGPVSSEYPEEPVGLYFTGIRYQGITRGYRHFCSVPLRPAIRNDAVDEMFRMIYRIVILNN